MDNDPSIESAIQQYLDAVAESLSNTPPERQDTLLRELREHIQEAIHSRTSGRPATLQDAYATLSEMDSPQAYADTLTPEHEERKPNTKLIVLGLLCSGLQIAGLATTVAGIPGFGAIAGFAAVVTFFLVWSSRPSPKWLNRLTAAAAICGVGLIIIGLAQAL